MAKYAAWSWYVTLTFADDVSLGRASQSVRSWADELAKLVGTHVPLALGVEVQRRGVLHIHGLVAFPDDIVRPTVDEGRAFWPHGHSQIRLYDPTRGGAWYVVKLGVWSLTSGCPRRPCCRRTRGCVEAGRHLAFPIP